MIDAKVLEISRQMTASKLEDGLRQIQGAVGLKVNEYVVRGAASGGAVVSAISQVYSEGIRALVRTVWATIWQVATKIGIEPSPDLLDELKAEMRAQIAPHFERLRGALAEHERKHGGPGSAFGVGNLISAFEAGLSSVDAEVELAVASLKGKPSPTSGSTHIHQNFHGPVGTVVTGSGTTTVIQNIGPQQRADLDGALEALRAAITEARDVRDVRQRNELIEVVVEAQQEVKKDEPNGLRLTSLLGGLAQTIQTIGSASAAYQAVKIAASAWGFQLP